MSSTNPDPIVYHTSEPNMVATVDLFTVVDPNNKTLSLYDGKGYVKLVDMMPRIVPVGRTADIAIVRNARTSYLTTQDKPRAADAKLIKFLVKNKHTSPLESVVFQFEMRVPIYVARHVLRHRTARGN